MFCVQGKLVDIRDRKIYPAEVCVNGGKIVSVNRLKTATESQRYILPGFIDSHVHIESSMLVPSEFARLAVIHGTVATVSDPHEIANVCGIRGVDYMIKNGSTVPFKFNFGAPSCVPATPFETAGAKIKADDVKRLLQRADIKYLSEMMNFPGVLNGDKEVMQKIESALKLGKPVDGHAPGLREVQAKKYIDAGITTDHECVTKEEALDKLKAGMKILIREGSAARNFDALIDLLNDYPNDIMFCSDDKHPDSLVEGHINKLCARAVAKGIDIFNVVQAACVNPVLHYKLEVGLLQPNEDADFIVVEDLEHFNVLKTYINGELVAEEGRTRIASAPVSIINNFNCDQKTPSDFIVKKSHLYKIPVIEALDGQLITNKIFAKPKVENDNIISDTENDILKIAVVNRYKSAPVATAFIKNFGLKQGAIASSVAHDSHNIVVVGVDDESMAKAVNLIINEKGGICAVTSTGWSGLKNDDCVLPLPIAGLMSNKDGFKVAAAYTEIDAMAKQMGSNLGAPFMTLSFMALLVIPELKLSDKGLFDGKNFEFISPRV